MYVCVHYIVRYYIFMILFYILSAINDLPPTDQNFIEQLHELGHKINVVKEQGFKGSMACTDVRDVLEKLKLKAVSKIREFVLQRVYQCRKPMSNYQVPQNALLKYRYRLLRCYLLFGLILFNSQSTLITT